MLIVAIILSFIAGWVSYHFLNAYRTLSGMSHMGTLLELELCLFVMRITTKLIDKNVKHTNMLLEKGYSPEQIKIVKNEDEHDLRNWQKSIVSAFIEYFPENLVRRYEISAWEDITKLGFEYYLYKEGDKLVKENEEHDGNSGDNK